MGFNQHIIRTYCLNHNLPISQFAKQISITKTHLFNIVWGKKYPSDTLALRIEEVTHGEIKASELKKPKSEEVNGLP